MVDRKELLKSVSPISQVQYAKNYDELCAGLRACINDMMEREHSGGKKEMLTEGDLAVILGAAFAKMETLGKKQAVASSSPMQISGSLEDVVAVLIALQNMPEALGAARIELEVKVVLVP
ncbi:MAG: hypothetical protein E6K18_08050 [Methanobacteriota archaeon]|nr:MAG: hypothetical protein E6K18_08050 [Euryarchaeota archaeon]